MNKLYHYTDKPFNLHKDQTYHIEMEDYSPKPSGLWFSVEDFEEDQTWKSWCLAEEFCLDNLKYCYKINLTSLAKVIVLSSAGQIMEFQYLFPGKEPFPIIRDLYTLHKTPWLSLINWIEVKKLYDAIIIAPYQWSCRPTMWYYGWDCASGCIWNLNCIESFTLMKSSECVPVYAKNLINGVD